MKKFSVLVTLALLAVFAPAARAAQQPPDPAGTKFSVNSSNDDTFAWCWEETTGGYPPEDSNCYGSSPSDTFVGTSKAKYPPGVGYGEAYEIDNGLLSFDTSSLPDNVIVTGATLRVHPTYVQNANSRDLAIEWHQWDEANPINSHTALWPNNALSGKSLGDFQVGIAENVPLQNAGANINKTGDTELRLTVSGDVAPTGENTLNVASYDHTTAPEPQLFVEYTAGDTIVNVTSAPYNATGIDATNDTTAFEDAMAAAGANTVTYVPNGTYYISNLQPPSNTELVVQDGVTIKKFGSDGVLFLLQGVANTSFAQNIDIYGVGGRFEVDISTGSATDSTPFRVRSVDGFSIKNVDIAANASDPDDDSGVNTSKPGISFLPMDTTKLNTRWEHAHNGVVENVHETGGAFGWGLAQLTGAEDVHFEDISSVGGIALRLENFENNATTIDDVTADGVTCTNGNAAVNMNPHNADNGDFHLTNVVANSCWRGLQLADDDAFPNGNFDNTSTIDNVDVFDGTTAQIRNTSAGVGPWAWTVGDAEHCVNKEASLNYSVTITNVSCDGLPNNNWP